MDRKERKQQRKHSFWLMDEGPFHNRIPKLSKQLGLARRMYSSNLFINGVLLFRKRSPTIITFAKKKIKGKKFHSLGKFLSKCLENRPLGCSSTNT